MPKESNTDPMPQCVQTDVSVSVTETRVGNLIFNDYGEIQPIYGVDEKSILTKVEENGWSICFKPKGIPITEERLLKIGFIKKDKIWSDKSISENLFFKENYFIEFSREGILFCQLHYSGDAWFLKNIEYIHQLQNLYFALKSSELQVSCLTEH